jgi:hypothetical protein
MPAGPIVVREVIMKRATTTSPIKHSKTLAVTTRLTSRPAGPAAVNTNLMAIKANTAHAKPFIHRGHAVP